MAGNAPETIDQYLAAQPADAQPSLQVVRRTIREAIPNATEVISYQMPTFQLGGRTVLHFAGWQKHYALYPATDGLVEAFRDELAPYDLSGKGTIRFPLSEPVPVDLIRRIAAFRATEANERNARR